MEEVEIVSGKMLTDEEKNLVNHLAKEYSLKIKRIVKNQVLLKIHFKEYNKEGKRKKYSLHVEAVFAGRVLNSNSWDYDLARAIHKSMKKIESGAEHTFHSSEQK
jgi:hypothetical protein